MNADASRITADKPCLPPHAPASRELLTDLLRDVSRSFYLTLRVLPKEIRPQVSLAYLLARASDTIADTNAVAKPERISVLNQLETLLAGSCVGADVTRDLDGVWSRPGLKTAPTTAGEMRLMGRMADCLALFASFSEADRQRIADLLHTIIAGQIFDLEKFPGETEHELVALSNEEELDRYTYMVAGCVGEFWTRMCQAHLPQLAPWRSGGMEELGVRFGKGLQLVNVLRDIPKDLRIGRCYLPVKEPRALLNPENFAAVQPLYDRWLNMAVAHLDAGWRYTMQIPPSLWRLRLACIWPIWIGLKTIARLREANPLDPSHRVKISRTEVYGLMLESFLSCRNDRRLETKAQRLFAAAQ